MASPQTKFVIIADDLTGSLDTGLQFRKRGLSTLVPLNWSRCRAGAEALVLNTTSRNLPGDAAYRKVRQICRRLGDSAIYKKIDSTMRGNIGREALAILESRKIPRAIIVPTIPHQGRTVEKGVLRVHGIPLIKTAYARDPFHPLGSSRVYELLERETGEAVDHVGLKEVRKSPALLAQRMEKSPARLLAVDAVSESDLQSIALACRLLPGRVLACGSVGLAEHLGPPPGKGKGKPGKMTGRPLLIISASRNPATRNQIQFALPRSRFPIVEPDLARLTNPSGVRRERETICRRLGELLAGGAGGAVLSTTFQEHLPGKENVIPPALGKAAVRLMEEIPLGGLVLTGGDLALGVCRRLSSSALRIEEEVLPGIPCSTLVDGPFRGLPVVTKAGGFGEEDALWKIIRYLKGNHER